MSPPQEFTRHLQRMLRVCEQEALAGFHLLFEDRRQRPRGIRDDGGRFQLAKGCRGLCAGLAERLTWCNGVLQFLAVEVASHHWQVLGPSVASKETSIEET